jgi:hypothetical protein
MSNIVAKFMASTPRLEAERDPSTVPLYAAATPSRPGTPENPEDEAAPVPSPAITAAEMTYRVVKKLLDELSPAERAACLRRLSKDIFESVLP